MYDTANRDTYNTHASKHANACVIALREQQVCLSNNNDCERFAVFSSQAFVHLQVNRWKLAENFVFDAWLRSKVTRKKQQLRWRDRKKVEKEKEKIKRRRVHRAPDHLLNILKCVMTRGPRQRSTTDVVLVKQTKECLKRSSLPIWNRGHGSGRQVVFPACTIMLTSDLVSAKVLSVGNCCKCMHMLSLRAHTHTTTNFCQKASKQKWETKQQTQTEKGLHL